MYNELDNIGKKTPFTVPDGYFESLHNSITQAVDQERKKQRRTTIVKWTMSAAAVIATIAVIAVALLKPMSPTEVITTPNMIAQNGSDTATQTTLAMSGEQEQYDNTETSNDATAINYQELTNEEVDEWGSLAEYDEFINCSDNYDIY